MNFIAKTLGLFTDPELRDGLQSGASVYAPASSGRERFLWFVVWGGHCVSQHDWLVLGFCGVLVHWRLALLMARLPRELRAIIELILVMRRDGSLLQ
jgi:hypothetical protein